MLTVYEGQEGYYKKKRLLSVMHKGVFCLIMIAITPKKTRGNLQINKGPMNIGVKKIK